MLSTFLCTFHCTDLEKKKCASGDVIESVNPAVHLTVA